jgi:hypothetical protein
MLNSLKNKLEKLEPIWVSVHLDVEYEQVHLNVGTKKGDTVTAIGKDLDSALNLMMINEGL